MTEENLSGFYIYYKAHVKTGLPATDPLGLSLVAVKTKGHWIDCEAHNQSTGNMMLVQTELRACAHYICCPSFVICGNLR